MKNRPIPYTSSDLKVQPVRGECRPCPSIHPSSHKATTDTQDERPVYRTMNSTNFFLWFTTVLLSKFIKLSLSLGSYAVGLSGITVTLPLMGRMMSLTSTCIVAGTLGTICAFFTGLPLTFGLPSIAATLSWACSSSTQKSHRLLSFVLHFLLPLGCMTIFMTHPVGSQAWYYALYWLIPVCMWLSKSRHVFMHALQSTFVAHAVGGTLWLLTGSLTAAQWTALIPVVAFERFMIAGLSTCVWYGIQLVGQKINRPVVPAEQRAA